MAEWLGSGLQNRLPRFNSGSRLQDVKEFMNWLTAVEIVLSLLLICVILVQQQGTGLGGSFGGEGNVYRSKRGAEKFLFYATIGLSIAFFVIAIVALRISS